jgi:hypothetical protein|uniref:Uncharacterized protein n=1 Tax=Siphoviridae sp. ctpoI7 TaxID=2825678 RepID=A0A8S5PAD5_9CAUD|nr:MAG TPA: hypothetical protein [Siphoviridae sp. ctpoI7]
MIITIPEIITFQINDDETELTINTIEELKEILKNQLHVQLLDGHSLIARQWYYYQQHIARPEELLYFVEKCLQFKDDYYQFYNDLKYKKAVSSYWQYNYLDFSDPKAFFRNNFDDPYALAKIIDKSNINWEHKYIFYSNHNDLETTDIIPCHKERREIAKAWIEENF